VQQYPENKALMDTHATKRVWADSKKVGKKSRKIIPNAGGNIRTRVSKIGRGKIGKRPPR